MTRPTDAEIEQAARMDGYYCPEQGEAFEAGARWALSQVALECQHGGCALTSDECRELPVAWKGSEEEPRDGEICVLSRAATPEEASDPWFFSVVVWNGALRCWYGQKKELFTMRKWFRWLPLAPL